jgi:hypothetical protein
MPFNKQKARQFLCAYKFKELFIEELGWDHYNARPIALQIENEKYVLTGIVEKRGMTVFECSPDSQGYLPPSTIRRKIENQIRKSAVEHIIIYVNAARTHQKWQWIRRESGRPIASREHDLTSTQSGEALLQKLSRLEIPVDEEGELTIFGVTTRAKAAFDLDKVTKKFYDHFKQEHGVFLTFIKGIVSKTDKEWYASLMLNRLMFCYFIQYQGFLDGDKDYLRNRMKKLQETKGKDKFYSFYRHFLLRLFHEGLGNREHSKELDSLIGKVPYLNGGFFDIHKLEQQNSSIEIPDKAFERVFDFLSKYHWHLDERPLRKDDEINPDVIGYIFEKYINQKQMGAYYTKEDITGYISKNTIIPWLFDATKKKCEIAFEPDSPMWRLIKDDPDRYIYPAMRKGVIADTADVESGLAKNSGEIIPLPKEIEAGIKDVAKRGNWNTPCDDSFALPTEIWREHVARRQRCLEIRQKLVNGEIHQINDLITYNLDIVQFAEDAISKSEGPEFLRATYDAITSISVIDPTCGSGAFLFAALNILEELYDACINRMEIFIDDADRAEPGNKKYKDFRQTLEQMAKHPSRQYFIYKSIIINNLFGVDIMEEAVEICKLRLFLKLVSQVQTVDQIEPLPDIDFNVRAGNTLVGFATYEELKKSQEGQMDLYGDFAKLDEEAEKVSMAYERYKSGQLTDAGTKELHESKRDLEIRLENLNERLNEYLSRQYGIDKYEDFGGNDGLFPRDNTLKQTTIKYEKWLASHQPFHWFAEFYQIMHKGGFDVVIGNPPYVVYNESKVNYKIIKNNFITFPSKNLYAYVFERSIQIVSKNAFIGLIVQLTAITSESMSPLQEILIKRGQLIVTSFPRRPESMFDGVEMPVSILLSSPQKSCIISSKIFRFYSQERPFALDCLELHEHCFHINKFRISKIGNLISQSIFEKILRCVKHLDEITSNSSQQILYYQEACRYWVKSCYGYPYFKKNGKRIEPAHGRTISFQSANGTGFAVALLNSSLFYLVYSSISDCEHINDNIVRWFPIPTDWHSIPWDKHTSTLSKDLQLHANRKTIQTKEGHKIEYDELDASKSKPIIDQIDTLLAKHYGFTDEELDYIINYDIKYRMGSELEGESDA